MKTLKFLTAVLASALVVSVCLTACSQKETVKEDTVVDVQTENTEETEKEEVIENPLGFNNVTFFKAVAECLGKEPSAVTEEDIAEIRYLAIGPEGDGTITAYVGLVDYVDYALSESPSFEELEKLVKKAVIEDHKNVDDDLGRFVNLEMFEYYDFNVKDVSFINNYHQLIMGYFSNNGITDVSSLASYNPETLFELDFTGNDIEDWSPLYDIKEKVIVNYSLQDMTDEDGNPVQVPFVLTLDEMLESETEQTEESVVVEEDTEQSETTVEYTQPDWSALFGE